MIAEVPVADETMSTVSDILILCQIILVTVSTRYLNRNWKYITWKQEETVDVDVDVAAFVRIMYFYLSTKIMNTFSEFFTENHYVVDKTPNTISQAR